MILPEHMDEASRNQRLYETLKGMGLFVEPVPMRNNPDILAGVFVSCGHKSAQQRTEKPAQTGVPPAVQRAQVVDRVQASDCGGGNVVDLPPVRR